MEGKKGVIFGVSNTHGIAYAIARQLYEAGADIAFTYAGEPMEKRVRPLAEEMGAESIEEDDPHAQSGEQEALLEHHHEINDQHQRIEDPHGRHTAPPE